MKARTTYTINKPAEKVWSLLCGSQMANHGILIPGVPRPLECRLDSDGAVGGKRVCVSDKGRIEQRILHWEPPKRLAFEMERTFDLEPIGEKTRITRTTGYAASGQLAIVKELGIWLGLKQIHRYVFANWNL